VQHDATRPCARRVTLDIDSSESPVHGAQEQSAYNGHFESVCYHPLFVFNQYGDCLAAKLRPGNVHSADGWDEVLIPVIDRCRAQGPTVVVRADAAFALPALYESLERRGVAYAIHLPANANAESRAARIRHLCPEGRNQLRQHSVSTTCEDTEERDREGVVEKAARLTSILLASVPIRTLVRWLPRDTRKALTTVLLTAVDVLRTRNGG